MKHKKYIKKGYDLDFLARVQPQGGIKYFSNYILTGDGYSTWLRVVDYPRDGLSNLWLADLLEQDYVNGFLAIKPETGSEVKAAAEKSINEKGSRVDGKAKVTDNARELSEIADLMDVVSEIDRQGEAYKGITIRLKVAGETEEILFQRVKKIRDDASQFKLTVMLDELLFDEESVFTAPSRHDELLSPIHHRLISSKDLAGGYFFNHTKLEDPTGSFFGTTKTGGVVQYDWLLESPSRVRPFMLTSGNPKMGQGTFATAIVDDSFARGHDIRNINLDQSDTLNNYTEGNGGLVIDMAGGSQYKVNIFQVFPMATDQQGNVDEIRSFDLHVANLRNVFEVLNRDATSDDIDIFEDLVTEFYTQYPNENNPLYYRNPLRHLDKLKVTKIPNEEYPTLKEFVTFSESQMVLAKTPELQTSYRRIRSTFAKLLATKPNVFEGTTQISDLSDESLVTFDLSGLLAEPDYLNVQLFSVMRLITFGVVLNGKIQRDRKAKNPQLLKTDLKHTIVNITNLTNLLSPQYPSSSELTMRMVETLAQNYAGILVQVGSFQRILGDFGTSVKAERHQAAMRELFGAMNYRAFGQTSSTDKQLLAHVLENEITDFELDAITNLEQGQIYLNIAGRRSVIFNQEYDADDFGVYGGWH